MNKLLATTVLLAGSAPLAAPTATAQTPILLDLYGSGVHAYYSHRSADATQAFNDAINSGLEDPRAYYFRGMVAYEQGNREAAEADWTTGAELEAQGKLVGPIGPALVRIQGPQRLKLEEIRQATKLRVLAQANARNKARYGEINNSAGDVLRGGPRPAPATNPAQVANPAPRVAPPPAPPAAVPGNDPFAAGGAGDPAVESPDALADAMNDPFADEPSAAAAPAAAAPAPAAGNDPFGGGADPFGEAPAAGAADPFGGDADPFGGDPFN